MNVRLTGITIQNFKNIVNGTVSFKNTRLNTPVSILGLFGQNGSGKTAIVDACNLLQTILCDMPLSAETYYDIKYDEKYAFLKYDFEMRGENTTFIVSYEFKLGKNTDTSTVSIYDEILKCGYTESGSKTSISSIIDTSKGDTFGPVNKYALLVGKGKEKNEDIKYQKRKLRETSKSFVFSKELFNYIKKNKDTNTDILFDKYYQVLESLINYGERELYVLKTDAAAFITLNYLPMYYSLRNGDCGLVRLALDEVSLVKEEHLPVITRIISNINIVLTKIIPGLALELNKLGMQLTREGIPLSQLTLMSKRDNITIPFRYESDGIKKLVSILNLLICVVNQDSITVVIDELDSGVFEYLLGELLSIIAEQGRGQLIFTSHCLRPLETLDRGYVAFTSTNPENRYIRLVDVKEDNNLRDLYYRGIQLGGQKETLYDFTSKAAISLAFLEAGLNENA